VHPGQEATKQRSINNMQKVHRSPTGYRKETCSFTKLAAPPQNTVLAWCYQPRVTLHVAAKFLHKVTSHPPSEVVACYHHELVPHLMLGRIPDECNQRRIRIQCLRRPVLVKGLIVFQPTTQRANDVLLVNGCVGCYEHVHLVPSHMQRQDQVTDH